jgi:hypothetical protein
MDEQYETEEQVQEIKPVLLPGMNEPIKVVKDNGLSGMFTVPDKNDNDMTTEHLTAVTPEDVFGGDTDMSDLTDITEEDVFGGDTDMSDLTQVDNADIIGRPMKRNRKPVFKRTRKVYNSPGSIKGMM